MSGIQVTSVADAIPFDPSAPSITPTSTGFNFTWNTSTGTWRVTDKVISHRQVWNPEITATTLNGTLAMDYMSHSGQILTGTATGYSVVLPDATTLENGWKLEIYNTTTQPVAVKDKAGTLIFSLGQSSVAYIYLQSNATLAGIWVSWQILQTTTTASGIIHYKIISSTVFSTSSTTDTPITGLSVTPQAGTYAVWFSADASLSANNSTETFTVYQDTTPVSDSKRIAQGTSSNFKTSNTTITIATFTGTQACSVYVSISSGSLTIGQRSLLLIRLGT